MHKYMPEKPPISPTPENDAEKEMTPEQLEQEIEKCSAQIEDLLGRNAGNQTFQTVISKKINERAGYIMKRDEMLRKESGKN